MNILTKDKKKYVSLTQFLNECPNYECFSNTEHINVDFDQIYKLTTKYFDQINSKIGNNHVNQLGGGFDKLIQDINTLYNNIKRYMKLHKIEKITKKTMIPYGIILSTLNFPNDLQILGKIYPEFISYLIDENMLDFLNFNSFIPIGIFLNDNDLYNINHTKD